MDYIVNVHYNVSFSWNFSNLIHSTCLIFKKTFEKGQTFKLVSKLARDILIVLQIDIYGIFTFIILGLVRWRHMIAAIYHLLLETIFRFLCVCVTAFFVWLFLLKPICLFVCFLWHIWLLVFYLISFFIKHLRLK